MTLDLIGVEGVEWLSKLKENVVGDVDQVVLWVDTCGTQLVLHPLWGWSNSTTRNGQSCITRCSLGVLYNDLERHIVVVYLEILYRWHLQTNILATATQISYQVASYADMRCGVDTVRCKTNANEIVILDTKEVACRHTDRSILGELHNTLVRGADTQLILGTQHTERLYTANLATLNLELLVASVGIEHSSYRGTHNLQALAAVSSSADNLQRLLCTYIDSCDMQVV